MDGGEAVLESQKEGRGESEGERERERERGERVGYHAE